MYKFLHSEGEVAEDKPQNQTKSMTSGWTGSGRMEGVSEERSTCQSHNLTYNKVYLFKKKHITINMPLQLSILCAYLWHHIFILHTSTLKMEAARSTETSATQPISTWCKHPKRSTIIKNEPLLKLEMIEKPDNHFTVMDGTLSYTAGIFNIINFGWLAVTLMAFCVCVCASVRVIGPIIEKVLILYTYITVTVLWKLRITGDYI